MMSKEAVIPTINMGLNTGPSHKAWEELVSQFKEAVETHGAAKASWGCTGRTLHLYLANQLEKALRDEGYEWDIDYLLYRCEARKVN